MHLTAKTIPLLALLLAACDGEAVPVNQVDRRGPVPEMGDGQWQQYCAQNGLSDLDRADCAMRERQEGIRERREQLEAELGQ